MVKCTIKLSFDSSLCFITEDFDSYGYLTTTIVTTEHTYYYHLSSKQLLHMVLQLRGSNLQSTLQTAKTLLRMKKQLPILIDFQKKLILIPVYSIRSTRNTYFNPFNISIVQPIDSKNSTIVFTNDSSLTVPLSERTIYKKYMYAQKLLNKLTHYQNHAIDPDDF